MPFHPLDVTCAGDLAARRFAVDAVVKNAGIAGVEAGPVPCEPEPATLAGVFPGCRYAIGAMKGRGAGSILNIGSRSGLVGIPGAAASAASKAGVRKHTKSVALWCAERGWSIHGNAITPAAILTPMWEPVLGTGPDRAARMAEFAADTPLRRFGTPDEVAAPAVLLASDEAPALTGAELTIDGGLPAGTAARPG